MKLTLIARLGDGLPLADSMADGKEFDPYVKQAKQIFKQLNDASPRRLSIDTDDYVFHYIIEKGVCYLALCEKRYPRKLAFCYLEELQKEFDAVHGAEVAAATRPYAFVKFDIFIQKTKKLYVDTRTQRNLAKLNEDLHDAQKIMTKNILDVLGRLERIENVSSMSSTLSLESKKYLQQTRNLNRYALLRKWGPLAAVIFIVVFLMWHFVL